MFVNCHHQGEVVPFKSYLYRFPTPYEASKSSSPLWYAIRRASAHIIILSSYSPFGNYSFPWLLFPSYIIFVRAFLYYVMLSICQSSPRIFFLIGKKGNLLKRGLKNPAPREYTTPRLYKKISSKKPKDPSSPQDPR